MVLAYIHLYNKQQLYCIELRMHCLVRLNGRQVYLTGVLGSPNVAWFFLKVGESCLGELSEGDNHRILHKTQPVLHVSTSLHLLQAQTSHTSLSIPHTSLSILYLSLLYYKHNIFIMT